MAKPEDYLIKDESTLLVSFASGNSPESLAAVEVANQVVETIHHLAMHFVPKKGLNWHK